MRLMRVQRGQVTQKGVRRTNMQRRMTDAKGHRAHKRIKAFKGSITHSKTR